MVWAERSASERFRQDARNEKDARAWASCRSAVGDRAEVDDRGDERFDLVLEVLGRAVVVDDDLAGLPDEVELLLAFGLLLEIERLARHHLLARLLPAGLEAGVTVVGGRLDPDQDQPFAVLAEEQ